MLKEYNKFLASRLGALNTLKGQAACLNYHYMRQNAIFNLLRK